MPIGTEFWEFILRDIIGDQTSSIEFYTGGEAAQIPVHLLMRFRLLSMPQSQTLLNVML